MYKYPDRQNRHQSQRPSLPLKTKTTTEELIKLGARLAK